MKSRFAVSVLFVLIAGTFTPDAIGALEKLRLWTGKLSDRYFAQACNGVTVADSTPPSTLKAGDEHRTRMQCLDGSHQPASQDCATGNQRRVSESIGSGGDTVTFNSGEATKILSSHERCLQDVVLRFAGSDRRSGGYEFIKTAARQMRQVLDLMSIK